MWVIQTLLSGWPPAQGIFFNLVHHCLLSVVTSETLIFFWRAFLAFQFRNSLINRSLLCQYLIIFFFICHLFIHSNSYPIPQIPRIVLHWLDTHSYCPRYQKLKEWLWKRDKSCKTTPQQYDNNHHSWIYWIHAKCSAQNLNSLFNHHSTLPSYYR